MKKLLLITATALVFLTPVKTQAATRTFWSHNGSIMLLSEDGGAFIMDYHIPRANIPAGIRAGQSRLQAYRDGNELRGTAFVYSQYCPGMPIPYDVSGVLINDAVVELTGPAPLLDPNTCSIVGYTMGSGNAHITFTRISLPPPVAAGPFARPMPTQGSLEPRPMPGAGIALPQGQDAQRNELMRLGREFCKKYPSDKVCQGNGARR